MKKFSSLLVAAVLAVACNSRPSSSRTTETAELDSSLLVEVETATVKNYSEEENAPAESAPESVNLTPQDRLEGYWVGMFGENKINIALTEVLSDGTVKGYSVVSGNDRQFEGNYRQEGQTYFFTLREPGNDKYDGKFAFSINLDQPEAETSLKGKWTPYNSQLPAKTYSLSKRRYQYDPKAGQYPEASTRLLTEEEVQNLYKQELRIMRNEIYARHGYSFKMKDMRSHFDAEDWYMPLTTDVRNKLSKIEVRNSALIKEYEEYAQEFYDDDGR